MSFAYNFTSSKYGRNLIFYSPEFTAINFMAWKFNLFVFREYKFYPTDISENLQRMGSDAAFAVFWNSERVGKYFAFFGPLYIYKDLYKFIYWKMERFPKRLIKKIKKQNVSYNRHFPDIFHKNCVYDKLKMFHFIYIYIYSINCRTPRF